MSATILDNLKEAKDYIKDPSPMFEFSIKESMDNAISLLEKGYPCGTEIAPLLVEFGGIETVPEYSDFIIQH